MDRMDRLDRFVLKEGLEVPYISSKNNISVVNASKLDDKKYREEMNLFICEGLKLTLEALTYGKIRKIFLSEDDAAAIIENHPEIEAASDLLTVLESSVFRKVSDSRVSGGIVSLAEMPEKRGFDASRSGEIPVLILESLRDPGNLGTILRSACAFGTYDVVLYECADPYGKLALRGSMGAVFKLNISYTDDLRSLIEEMKKGNRRVIGTLPQKGALVLGQDSLRRNDCFVIGNEGHGISEEVKDVCTDFITIKMEENSESLNAAVAAGVILYEAHKTISK